MSADGQGSSCQRNKCPTSSETGIDVNDSESIAKVRGPFHEKASDKMAEPGTA